MSDEDFHASIQPAIAALFGVNDRGVRVMLLTSIPSYGKRLEDKVVNDQVGMRATVCALPLLSPPARSG